MTASFALRVRLMAYVFDGRFESSFGTDVTERVKRAFKDAGILTVGDLPLRVVPDGPERAFDPCDSARPIAV